MTTRSDINGFIAERPPAIAGVWAYPSFAALPEPVGGVIVCVPPAEAVKIVRDAFAHPSAFIHRAHGWMWQMIGKVPA